MSHAIRGSSGSKVHEPQAVQPGARAADQLTLGAQERDKAGSADLVGAAILLMGLALTAAIPLTALVEAIDNMLTGRPMDGEFEATNDYPRRRYDLVAESNRRWAATKARYPDLWPHG
jgi:hypothetical protein